MNGGDEAAWGRIQKPWPYYIDHSNSAGSLLISLGSSLFLVKSLLFLLTALCISLILFLFAMGGVLAKEAPSISDECEYELPDNIISNLVAANSFEDNGREYLPEGKLETLVTATDIGRILSTSKSLGDDELVHWIAVNAKKVFALTVIVTKSSIKTRQAMILFRTEGFTDKSLPVDNPREKDKIKQDLPKSLTWHLSDRFTFYQTQFQFLAPVFEKKTYSFNLREEHILPFNSCMDRAPGDGAFSKVYCLEIEQSHNGHLPLKKVRLKLGSPFG